VFLPVGGALADIGWRLPFLVYLAPLALVPLVIGWVNEPDRPGPEVARDGGPNSPNSSDSASRSGKPLRSIGRPALGRLAAIYGTMVAAQAIYFTIPVRMPFYLRGVAEASGAAIGAAIAPMLFVGGVVSTRFGRVNRRVGVVGAVALHFAVMGIGYAVVTLSSDYAGVIAGLAVTGLGLGLQLPAFNTWAAAAVPDGLRGRALGGLTSALFVGQFCSPILTRPLVEQVGLDRTYGIIGLAMVGLAVVLIAARSRIRPPASIERGSEERRPSTET
jgi:predicted MFS family arabinose efflux permease